MLHQILHHADDQLAMGTLKGCDAAELLRIRDKVDELLQGQGFGVGSAVQANERQVSHGGGRATGGGLWNTNSLRFELAEILTIAGRYSSLRRKTKSAHVIGRLQGGSIKAGRCYQ